MYMVYIVFFFSRKSYILDISYIHYVHPYTNNTLLGDHIFTDSLTSISATIGGGFFGGLLLGYALKKAVKMIAIVVGLFIAGLAYLQYHK
jgi:FUN14 family